MRVLLDTHALLWWLTDDAQLSAHARSVLAEGRNDVFVSAASAWEIATKQRIGKLPGVAPVAQWLGPMMDADRFAPLPISHVHALRAGAYAVDHRDPFDRMLAAQSEIERLPLVTRDQVFSAFGCRTVW